MSNLRYWIGFNIVSGIGPARLKKLLDHFGEAVGEPITRDMTLDEMATRIGSTREMVCRHLYRLSDQGAIHINRTEFKITNRGMLEKIGGKTDG